MRERDLLPIENKKYQPLYRPNDYKQEERLMWKYISSVIWYKDIDLGDEFRQHWKRKIKFKETRCDKKKRSSKSAFWKSDGKDKVVRDKLKKIKIESVIFVPSTKDGILANLISEEEKRLSLDTGWRTKILERSGTPLSMLFRPTFPSENGCVLGEDCKICDNDGRGCNKRNLTYKIWCTDCEQTSKNLDLSRENVTEENDLEASIIKDEELGTIPTYIGETSRPIRARAKEHWNNLRDQKENSFMMLHWMHSHGTSASPPNFKCKQINKYRDSLSRQIGEAVWIITDGNLNNKNEYGVNHLCRLVDDKMGWEVENDYITQEKERNERKIGHQRVH